MRARAPQWLLMFCGGWTLFTLLSVTWQPLIVFQLALIWGGYAFFSPKGLSQKKFWETDLWEAWLDQGAGLKPVQMPRRAQPQPSAPATDQNQAVREAAGINPSTSTGNSKRRRLNKHFIVRVFIVIVAINIVVHLYPFDYNSTLALDQIARAVGTTVAIFLVSLVGLLFRPNKTFGMAAIAILAAPWMILLDRANDPIAPQVFRDFLDPTGSKRLDVLSPDTAQSDEETANNFEYVPVNVEGVGEHEDADPVYGNAENGGPEYQRHLDLFIKADPILSPETYDTSDMPATKAANAELARQRLEAMTPEAGTNDQPSSPNP